MSKDAATQLSGIATHLTYERPADAVEWLCRVFGLRESRRTEHTVRGGPSVLTGPCGGSVVIWGLTEDFKDWMRSRAPRFREPGERPWPYLSHSVSVQVPDVDAHYERSERGAASVLSLPNDQPWGVRSYAALDPEGHQWEFVQVPGASQCAEAALPPE